MTWPHTGRNENHLPSFSSSIIFWVYISMSSRSQRGSTDLTGESMNHFRRNLHMLWPQNMEDNLVREVLRRFLSVSLAWPLTYQCLPLLMVWLQMYISPFFLLFSFYLVPDLTWHCLVSTILLIKYVLLVPWLKNFYNLFYFPFHFIFFNPVIMFLFAFLICSEGSISLSFWIYYHTPTKTESLHLIPCWSLFYSILHLPPCQ